MSNQAVTQTPAEVRAEEIAAIFRAQAWAPEITVTHTPADLYSDGEEMLPASVRVSLWVPGKAWYDNAFSASWVTYLPTRPGRRRATSFLGAKVFRSASEDVKLASEARARNWAEVITGAWNQA